MDYLITGRDYLKQFPDFELIGRQSELFDIYSILSRSQANNVILTGPRGVQLDRICKGIQATKNNPDCPFDISGKRLYWLDTNGLFSSGDTAEINNSFQKSINKLTRSLNSVLIIEDTRDFIDSAASCGCSYFINSIVSIIRGETQVILNVDDDDLEYVLKKHNDLRELFTIKYVDEPTGAVLEDIVTHFASQLEQYHGIRIAKEAIRTSIDFTNKYQTRDPGLSRAQPERASTLLDRSLSTYKLNSHSTVPAGISESNWLAYQEDLKACSQEQRSGEDAISQLEEEIEKVYLKNSDDNNPSIVEFRSKIRKYEIEVKRNFDNYQKLTKIINEKLVLTQDAVIAEFSHISGISASKLNQNELEKLKTLNENLKKRVIGQDRSIERIANAIRVSKVGGRNKNKPIACFFLLGPSGVGKTETAKALAYNVLGDDSALSRFDMSEYQEKHAVATLIGSPPGYEGFEAGGLLTNLVRKNGNRVVLFDEVEKGHPDVYDILLQVVDAGRLTDKMGRTANFNETIVILTTNIGSKYFLDENLDYESARLLAIQDLESKGFRPEFLNRFGGREYILGYDKLNLDTIKIIAKKEFDSINNTYTEKGISISISDSDLYNFCKSVYNPESGARGLPGLIETKVETNIVNKIIDNPNVKRSLIIKFNTNTNQLEIAYE